MRQSIQKINKIFFILLLLAISGKLLAEEVTAEAGFDKATITIGEKVRYSITVEAPKDTKIEFPVIDSMLTNTGFAIRDFGEEKPVKLSKDRVRIRHWYLLDTYVVGSYNVPAVTITYTFPYGTKGSAETKDVFLEVKSVIKEGEKAEDIRDIKKPVEIKYSYKKMVIWSVIILLLILTLAIGIPLYLKFRKFIIPPAPPIPAHIIALRELEKIKEMALDTEEKIKEYYVGISGIVRHYIEIRFNLHAPERTTEEFLFELTASDKLVQIHKGLLRDFLKHCDMVKFAKYGPTKEEIDGVYNTAKRFVEETAQKTVTNSNYQ